MLKVPASSQELEQMYHDSKYFDLQKIISTGSKETTIAEAKAVASKNNYEADLKAFEQGYAASKEDYIIDLARDLEPNYMALEENAVDVITGEQSYPENLARDTLRTEMRNWMALLNEIHLIEQKAENRSTVGKVWDFVSDFVPPFTIKNFFSNIGGEEGEPSAFNVSTNLARELEAIYQIKDEAEATAAIKEWVAKIEEQSGWISPNLNAVMRVLQDRAMLDTNSVLSPLNLELAMTAADYASLGILPLQNAAGKLATRLGGNRRLTALLQGDTAQARLHTILQNPGDVNPAVATEIFDLMKEQGEIVSRSVSDDLRQLTAYTEDELQELLVTTKDKWEDSLGGRIMDVQWADKKLAGGQIKSEDRVNVFIDLVDHDPLMSTAYNERMARMQADALHLKDYTLAVDPSTRRFFAVVEDYPYTRSGDINVDIDTTLDLSFPYIRSARGKLGDNLYRKVLASQETYQKTIERSDRLIQLVRVADDLMPMWMKLKKKQPLNELLTKGNQDAKWYDAHEFVAEFTAMHGRAPTKNETLAYGAIRAISDIDYQVRVLDIENDMSLSGYRSYEVNGTEFIGKEINKLPRGVIPLDKWGNQVTDTTGRRLVQSEADPETVYALVPEDAVISSIDGRIVLPYREGGHRAYEATAFVKNARIRDGNMYNPRTLTGYKSFKEAERVASALDEARILYNQVQSGAITQADFNRLVEPFSQTLSGMRYNDFHRMVLQGDIQPGQVIQAVRSGDEMPIYKETKLNPNANDFVSDLSENTAAYLGNRGIFNRPKRDILRRLVTREPIATLNVGESTALGLRNALKSGSYYSYRKRLLAQIFDHPDLAKHIDGNPSNARDSITRLKETEFRTDTEMGRVFNNLKKDFLFNLHNETVYSRIQDGLKRRYADWVFDSENSLSKFPGVTSTGAALLDTHPIRSLRSLAFDRLLGVFSYEQLYVQSITWMQLQALTPKSAARSYADTLLFAFAGRKQGYLPKKDFDKTLEAWINTIPGTSVSSVDEWYEMQRLWKATGMESVGGEYALLDELGESFVTSRMGQNINNIREAGRYFFYAAERNNRRAAFVSAYNELKDQGVDFSKKNTLELLRMRTDDYSINMTRAASSGLERGEFAPAVQFMSYMMRMAEQMTAGKTFTTAQKMRLMAWNLGLWGGAGVPLGTHALNAATQAGWLDPETAQWYKNGAFDKILLTSVFGEETNFAGRAAVGRGIDELINAIYEAAAGEGDAPIWTFLGPAGDTAYEGANLGYSYLTGIYNAALADEWSLEDFMLSAPVTNTATFIKSASNVYKAAHVLKYGEVYNLNTRQRVLNPDSFDVTPVVVMKALGIELAREDFIQSEYTRNLNRNQKVREYAKERAFLLNTQRLIARHHFESSSDEFVQAHQTVINDLRRWALTVPPEYKQEAIEMAQRMSTPKSQEFVFDQKRLEQAIPELARVNEEKGYY